MIMCINASPCIKRVQHSEQNDTKSHRIEQELTLGNSGTGSKASYYV